MFSLVILAGCSVALVLGCSSGRQMIRSGGLSGYERQAIVDSHNKLRQSVALGQITRQPPAANMMEMVWDDELASTAQRWADQCQPAHDGASQRDVGRFPVGQNIAATWTTRRPSANTDSQPDFNKQINAWFDEVRVFGFKPIGYGHGTGHYSQLVWGETSHVGCGFSFYYDPSRGYTKLYVCNYGPGGNVIGSSPYEKGSPACSNFGLSASQKYSGLCSASFTSSSSYESVPLDNSGNYVANVIPDSTGDAPSGYNGYSYNAYNQYSNQFSNQYQYQNSYSRQPSTYSQQANAYSQASSYLQPRKAYYQQNAYQTTEAATYKPFISIFNDATNLISSAKQSIFTPKRTGFKFGTIYL